MAGVLLKSPRSGAHLAERGISAFYSALQIFNDQVKVLRPV